MKVKDIQITDVLIINHETKIDNKDIKIATNPLLIPKTKKIALGINNKKNLISKYITLSIKRIIDVIGAVIGIALLVPILVVICISNIISGDFGPLFYAHKRIGKNGKYFKMYKFRSMCVDADEKLKKLLKEDEAVRKEWEESHKLSNDPRITKIGKFIRKTSLDEFPQFINVLKGEMSLVGPRAVVDGEIEKFGPLKNKVLSVKPGITGNWQVSLFSDNGILQSAKGVA